MSGVDDWADLRRRFDRWERDLSFFRVERTRSERSVSGLDQRVLWGDDPILTQRRPWFR